MLPWHVKVQTAPAVTPISYAEAALQIRDPDSQPDVERRIAAATAQIDGPDGWLGRALVTQTLDLTIDWGFPQVIYLPCPPLQSVTSVTYTDADGDTQTLAADQYRVLTDREPGMIVPAHGVTWPATRWQRGAVTVRYVAGYGLAAAVPQDIREWLMVEVGDSYDVRAGVIVGTSAMAVPHHRHAIDKYVVRLPAGANDVCNPSVDSYYRLPFWPYP